ncbi:MAG: dihydroorotate dehydrogenase, partial [Selenomonadaceae bacterium]|nr:dihydroorotate dehydrogenase [Selenomonadaceae bacterium]
MTASANRLESTLAGIRMKTPVWTASGTFGFGEEFADFVDLERLGAVVIKGTTLEPRRGNDGVRMAETPAGMLNSIGLENPGVDFFLTDILPRVAPYGM